MCVKDTGTKYQLWISDFNIDGTFTRVHPFIISHTKTMTRTREDGKEEVFSTCIKPDDTRYLGGNKSSSVNAIKLQGRPRTGINYDKANEFCANRGDWVTMINYLEYCAIQALCYIEYASFDNQAALNTNLTSDGFKQGGLDAGVTNLNWDSKRTNITKYYGKYVRIIQVINYAKYFRINFIRNGKAYYADSRDKTLFYSIHRLNHFPINFKITKYDWRIYTKSKKEKVKPQT